MAPFFIMTAVALAWFWRARTLEQQMALPPCGPTVTQATCGYQGKYWAAREDGMCYMEDLPK